MRLSRGSVEGIALAVAAFIACAGEAEDSTLPNTTTSSSTTSTTIEAAERGQPGRRGESVADGFYPVLTSSIAPCPEGAELLGDVEGEMCYSLGNGLALDDVLESANAEVDPAGMWVVALTLSEAGIDAFNELAATCFPADLAMCSTGQVAIVVGGQVMSAPTIQQPAYERDQIVISGQFTEQDARSIADAVDP